MENNPQKTKPPEPYSCGTLEDFLKKIELKISRHPKKSSHAVVVPFGDHNEEGQIDLEEPDDDDSEYETMDEDSETEDDETDDETTKNTSCRQTKKQLLRKRANTVR